MSNDHQDPTLTDGEPQKDLTLRASEPGYRGSFEAARDGILIPVLETDVIVPLMGGKAMAGRMKTTYPDREVLFPSSYTADAFVNQGELETGGKFLCEPYAPGVLVRESARVVGRAAGGITRMNKLNPTCRRGAEVTKPVKSNL